MRVPPTSRTSSWRTGGGSRLHARSTMRSNIESGSAPGAIGSGEDTPEPGGARRAWAIDPIQGLADPPLARPSPERVSSSACSIRSSPRTTAPRSHNVRAMFVHGMLSTRV